jgi:hypothetical protein
MIFSRLTPIDNLYFITEIKLRTTLDFTIMFEGKRNTRVVICFDCRCLVVYHCSDS